VVIPFLPPTPLLPYGPSNAIFLVALGIGAARANALRRERA